MGRSKPNSDGIYNPNAEWWFWDPTDHKWYDVTACGDLSIKQWVEELREAGFCIARRKK